MPSPSTPPPPTSTPPTPSSAAPRPNLDLLRTFAVALVVLDHTTLAQGIHRLPGGWPPEWIGVAGVFLFFVHTALVLMWSLERKPHTLDFYVRRLFRIYPLAITAVLATVLLHAPVSGTLNHFFQYHPPSSRTLLADLLLVQNIAPGVHTLPPAQFNILGPIWTLPLEVQMYLALPILFAFVRRDRALWPMLLLWAFLCLLCASLFDSSSTVLPMVVPCFLPGIMAFLLYGRVAPRLSPALLLPTLLLLLALFLQHPNTRHGWLFCLALGLLLPFFRELQSPWITRPAHHIAKYSFGIYLSHPFALVLAFYLLAGHNPALQYTVEFASIALLSVAGYHLIEHPFIRLGSRLANRLERRVDHTDSTDHTSPTSLDLPTPDLPSPALTASQPR